MKRKKRLTYSKNKRILNDMKSFRSYMSDVALRCLAQMRYSYERARRDAGRSLVVDVDPKTIQWTYSFRSHKEAVRSKGLLSLHYVCFFYPGDWDKFVLRFDGGDRYKNMLDLYINRDDYSKSHRFKDLVSALSAGNPHRKDGYDLSSLEGINMYCRDYINMFASLEREGYRADRSDETCKVAVARNGEIIKWPYNGFNRLAAAKIIGLDRIEVEVVRVHPEWMARFGGVRSHNIREAVLESKRF